MTTPEQNVRIDAMANLAAMGKSLREIGSVFRISAERCRQLLAKKGITTDQFKHLRVSKSAPKPRQVTCPRCGKDFSYMASDKSFAEHPRTFCGMSCANPVKSGLPYCIKCCKIKNPEDLVKAGKRKGYQALICRLCVKERAKTYGNYAKPEDPKWKEKKLKYHRDYQRERYADPVYRKRMNAIQRACHAKMMADPVRAEAFRKKARQRYWKRKFSKEDVKTLF